MALNANPRDPVQYLLRHGATDLATETWVQASPTVWGVASPPPRENLMYFNGDTVGRWVGEIDNISQPGDWSLGLIAGFIFVYSPIITPSSVYTSILRQQDCSIATTTSGGGRALERLREIYIPSRDQTIVYPDNPDRTLNYYHSPLRSKQAKPIRALNGTVNVFDQDNYDDVVNQEVWGGSGNQLSIPTNFVEALQIVVNEQQAIGRNVAWKAPDLNFDRHMIVPLDLAVSGSPMDLKEIRDNHATAEGSYVDRVVTFSFRLARPRQYAGSNLIAEGL
jgi:hypothetical protein